MANVWTKFKQLLPNNAQQIGVVETVHLDGTTTIELPDDLLTEAKAVAARRRITLKAMIEHALRREISFRLAPETEPLCEINQQGFPVLKKRGDTVVTSEMVYQIMDDEGI